PPNSGFALLGVVDHEGRRYGLSTELELVPLDRLERVRPSAFHGTTLESGLPIVFVKSRSAWLYSGQPQAGLSSARRLGFREAVPITGKSVRFGGVSYLETRTGEWLKDERLTRIDGFRERPSWAAGAKSWVQISILQQSLVAYEGDKPVYATLVSTGIDGLGDPKTTHSTVLGSFLVHTKHVTTTMQGEDEDDEFLLSDVPYVQYFTEGYALHAAYWHDAFGTPRSHGCVNLSPLDARFLFHWTEPAVPQAWHAALSLRGGTLVNITP
ncbi:MAG TPA: L,D-transpeptidase, partial [Polyangiaceae bacterium]|nr:L,D-transpeptidase [Polyangiaceae bacterium]